MIKRFLDICFLAISTALIVRGLGSCIYEDHMLCTPGERGKYFLNEERVVSWPPRMVFSRRSNRENFLDTVDLRLAYADTSMLLIHSQLEGACSYYDEHLQVQYSDTAKSIVLKVDHTAASPNLVRYCMESSGRLSHYYNGIASGTEDTFLVHENYDHAEKFEMVVKKDSGLTYLYGLKADILYKRLW